MSLSVVGHQCQFVRKNIDAARYMTERDRRITTESEANTVNISVGSAHAILVESLGISKFSARWVPRLLLPDHHQTQADLSVEILNKWDEDSEAFQQSNVTGDETWLNEYDLEDKIHSK